MIQKSFCALLFSLLILSQSISAQGFASLLGKVVDAETFQPLEEAIISVQYGGFSSGVNKEGLFILKYPNILTDSAIVKISAIGYQSSDITLANYNHDDTLFVNLRQVPPINVRLGISNARGLVQSALDSMAANHYKNGMLQNGFYQETATIKDVGVVKIREAVLRVERFPEDKETTGRVKALKHRMLDMKGQAKKVESWQMVNGPAVTTRAIETDRPDFLKPSALKKYDFEVDSLIIPYDSLALYAVKFKPKSPNLRGGREGIIYIDVDSKSIVKMVYALTPKALKEVIGKGFTNVKVTGDSLSFVSQYRYTEGKWVLHENRARIALRYEEKLDRKFKSDAVWDLRFVAMESRELRRYGITELDQLTDTLGFKKSRKLDPDTWATYGYLIPSKAMFEILEKL
ncbi:hypothetical protein [Jiulongibacter sp. NS-SX5]|uniref:hypothetical protein n=1 Tax=Jiulongibacter sp. NS-SX5 TaxID=3463854 RepID=UPI004058130C